MKNKINLLLIMLVVFSLIVLMGCVNKNYLCPNGETVSNLDDCNAEGDEGSVVYEGESTGEVDDKVVVEEKTTTKDTDSEPAEKEATPSNLQLELTPVQISKLDDLISNQKSVVYPKTLGGAEAVPFGGSYAYAFAIRNSGAKSLEFKFSMVLLESKTDSFSNGGADETVLEWFTANTNFDETFILGKNEIAYIPLVVVVGDKSNVKGDPVFAGTYKFRIYTETIEGPFDRDYHFTDFSLRVKE
ncbi:hypothetical protein HN695_06720 [Candidatus Woesearchaeota archaeon]|jgi:hypothetical protein|nr:hypothetical protein [Candidatus Woesearchaeota archaeon]MBT5271946.1 hypothetical protein [Candidatus Woesearchaeota archaeon]MBT6041058.1 hypothetical protein [Candidatus Woesearchaeota archaeon]MBT6336234.1 hypothetical protein [Candidatus Woesearchaeota archaeon]MBT7927999.1 hypothetical protein [Candidatus Woesearchaeota archaeon]